VVDLDAIVRELRDAGVAKMMVPTLPLRDDVKLHIYPFFVHK
jgi:hypothetical protein